jgi:hypothetical protein
MTPEQQLVQDIKAAIAEMSEDDQIKVKCITSTLKGILEIGGAPAHMAFALMGAQMASE